MKNYLIYIFKLWLYKVSLWMSCLFDIFISKINYNQFNLCLNRNWIQSLKFYMIYSNILMSFNEYVKYVQECYLVLLLPLLWLVGISILLFSDLSSFSIKVSLA